MNYFENNTFIIQISQPLFTEKLAHFPEPCKKYVTLNQKGLKLWLSSRFLCHMLITVINICNSFILKQ